MITVYGLKNCDTCRKAMKWLDEQGLRHQFIDVRKDGVEEADITRWIDAVGWETLLNKRGTTWRGLGDAVKESTNESTTAAGMGRAEEDRDGDKKNMVATAPTVRPSATKATQKA